MFNFIASKGRTVPLRTTLTLHWSCLIRFNVILESGRNFFGGIDISQKVRKKFIIVNSWPVHAYRRAPQKQRTLPAEGKLQNSINGLQAFDSTFGHKCGPLKMDGHFDSDLHCRNYKIHRRYHSSHSKQFISTCLRCIHKKTLCLIWRGHM